MNGQAIFNAEAIEMLPRIRVAINSACNFDANQMYYFTIKACCDCVPPVSIMCERQIETFESGLIATFNAKGWTTVQPTYPI